MPEGPEKAPDSSQPTGGNEKAKKLAEELKDIAVQNNATEMPAVKSNVDTTPRSTVEVDERSQYTEAMTESVQADGAESMQEGESKETEAFLSWLQEKGVSVPAPEAARQVLNDPDLFNQPLPPLLDKLGMTMEDARSIGMDLKKEITKVTAARFREYIANTDWKSRLNPENLNIVVNSEDSPRSVEEVSAAVSQILESDNLEFAQGAVWAMASAPDSPWVAKFVKSGEGSSSPEWTMNEMLEQRSDVAEVFGEDLLLDQVALALKDKNTPIILQEKVNLEEWEPMGAFNTDVLDMVAQAIAANSENRVILNDFLNKVQVLEEAKGLVLDFSGDNVVFRQDEQGRLVIKIIDYGCTKLEGEDPQRLAHLHEHAEALRALAV